MMSLVRVQLEEPNGTLVKWLRHCPFTAVTRVRISHVSPDKNGWVPVLKVLVRFKGNKWINTLSFERFNSSHTLGLIVQMVRTPPCHGGDHEFKSHSDRQKRTVKRGAGLPVMFEGTHSNLQLPIVLYRR